MRDSTPGVPPVSPPRGPWRDSVGSALLGPAGAPVQAAMPCCGRALLCRRRPASCRPHQAATKPTSLPLHAALTGGLPPPQHNAACARPCAAVPGLAGRRAAARHAGGHRPLGAHSGGGREAALQAQGALLRCLLLCCLRSCFRVRPSFREAAAQAEGALCSSPGCVLSAAVLHLVSPLNRAPLAEAAGSCVGGPARSPLQPSCVLRMLPPQASGKALVALEGGNPVDSVWGSARPAAPSVSGQRCGCPPRGLRRAPRALAAAWVGKRACWHAQPRGGLQQHARAYASKARRCCAPLPHSCRRRCVCTRWNGRGRAWQTSLRECGGRWLRRGWARCWSPCWVRCAALHPRCACATVCLLGLHGLACSAGRWTSASPAGLPRLHENQ